MGNTPSRDDERVSNRCMQELKQAAYQPELRTTKPIELREQHLPPERDPSHLLTYFVFDLFGPILLEVLRHYNETSIAIAINAGCDGQELPCVTSTDIRGRTRTAVEHSAMKSGKQLPENWQVFLPNSATILGGMTLHAVAESRKSEERVMRTAAHNALFGLQELSIEQRQGFVVT